VQSSVLEPFLDRFTARVDEIVVGDPRRPETTYGPLIHPVALKRVTGHVQTPDRMSLDVDEHEQILDAIEAGDARRAESLTRRHIADAMKRMPRG
jgi:delta 1-pyrroline-5-carboxylate dehydrogenase